MNSSVFKSFIESYAVIPLLLISFASVYKFGYFFNLKAVWILPSLSVQSLLYSILALTILFVVGCSLAYLYLRFSEMFGHLIVGLTFLFIFIVLTILLIFQDNLNLILQLLPLGAGAFYYIYADYSIFGSESEKMLVSPLIIFLSVFLLVIMFFIGVIDSSKENLSNSLSVVIFDEQKTYPSMDTDWRLLENLGDKLVLINLERYKDNKSYFIKIVPIDSVDKIL